MQALNVMVDALRYFGEYCEGPQFVNDMINAFCSVDAILFTQGFRQPLRIVGMLRNAVSRQLLRKYVECHVVALLSASGSAFLIGAAQRSVILPFVQDVMYERFFVARLLHGVLHMVTPRPVSALLRILKSSGSCSDDERQVIYASIIALHAESYEGNQVAGAVQRNFVAYLTTFVEDQILWAWQYYDDRKRGCSWQRTLKPHVAAAVICITEFATTSIVRGCGATVGRWLYRRDGVGAFWGEHAFLFASVPFLVRTNQFVGFLVYRWLCAVLPNTEADEREDAKDEEDVREEEHQQRDAVFAAASGKADLYEVLGVGRDASTADIKKAYRALALRYHPDKALPHEKDAAATAMAHINEANDVLSDPGKRAIYDDSRLQVGAADASKRFDLADRLHQRIRHWPLLAQLGVGICVTLATMVMGLYVVEMHLAVAFRAFASSGRTAMRGYNSL